MLSSLFFFTLLGLALFFLQELLLYPQVYIRPLAPLLFYVGLKDSLPLAFALAVLLGLLQDSYALSPFGIHLMSSLILVGVARFARQTFLIKNAVFKIKNNGCHLTIGCTDKTTVFQKSIFIVCEQVNSLKQRN